ncbi:MAG: NAD(P)-dependent glycerol-3-phosphate dehydrogenase [Proteobacteria bacterium]|nr:NAD(P)-dependent glycerol-3-phosphate dehydrogenase [Pseudomonadota bacterium]
MIRAKPIAVLGAGAWGTALALLLVRNGNAVRLWCYDKDQFATMRSQRANPDFLPGFPLPDALQIENDLALVLKGTDDLLIAVPSQAFTKVLHQIKSHGDYWRIVWGTKGLDAGSGRLLHEMVAEILGPTTPAAVLSGPSFAHELAAGLPTAASLSSNQSEFTSDLRTRFHGANFRVYENPDMIGVQLCGVMKNVLAVAVGISDGLNLGANARCALITRGMAEIARLNKALGGNPHTLMSLAGVGDIVLTCTDNQSRNRRFGLAVGQGMNPTQAALHVGKVIEGLNNVERVRDLSRRFLIEMPITEEIHKILYHGHHPKEVVANLLNREPRVE